MTSINSLGDSTTRRSRRALAVLGGASLLALGAFVVAPQFDRDGLTVGVNQALADSDRDGGESGGHGSDDSGGGGHGSDDSGGGGHGSDDSGHQSADSGPGNEHDGDHNDDVNDDHNDDDDGSLDQGPGDFGLLPTLSSDDGTADQGPGDN